MKSIYRFVFLFLLLIGFIIFLIFMNKMSNAIDRRISNKKLTIKPTPLSLENSVKIININNKKIVTICVVVCGDRQDESLTMLKSALIFTHVTLEFIIITEDNLIADFDEKLTEWKYKINKTFTYSIKSIEFPDHSDVTMWKKLFKPCAAQRLFLPVNIFIL